MSSGSKNIENAGKAGDRFSQTTVREEVDLHRMPNSLRTFLYCEIRLSLQVSTHLCSGMLSSTISSRIFRGMAATVWRRLNESLGKIIGPVMIARP